jgi:hypothetical protein
MSNSECDFELIRMKPRSAANPGRGAGAVMKVTDPNMVNHASAQIGFDTKNRFPFKFEQSKKLQIFEGCSQNHQNAARILRWYTGIFMANL